MAVQPFARFRADEGVFEDAAGTDAVEDTDLVKCWKSAAASAFAKSAVQSAGAREPVYAASDGGYPSIAFTDDVLVITHDSDWASWTGMSWLMAVYITTTNSNEYLWTFGDTAWDQPGIRVFVDAASATTTVALTFHPGAYNAAQFREAMMRRPTLNRWNILAGAADATSVRLWLNKQLIARHTITGSFTVGTRNKHIGGAGNATTYTVASMKLREMTWWSSMLTEAQMNTEVDDAMTRWGITNEIDPPAASGGGAATLINSGGLVG